ncbi:helix-turn-helix domain-containing protein [Streptomyces sp. ISL-94]|uniref:helix-turn-helix domain-containing protein n=1 Tax=Streptomyces sp. ISL-94 TaxID=2819190 RepID=UPI001BE90050|nr:helix-turn-helix transcriptional regulator [Streptomyces sp. ISL-94]
MATWSATATSGGSSTGCEYIPKQLEVFSARGFRAGSLNDIAEEAGLTRAGPLHHYPNKQVVLLAFPEQRDAVLALGGGAGGRLTDH